MSEIDGVWHPLRDNLGIYGHMVRIESPIESGIPDVAYTLLGCSGWVENKLFDKGEDCCPTKLTIAQILWAERQVQSPACGRWFLFGRFRQIWLTFDLLGAISLFKGEKSFPVLRANGKFPARQLLDILAPPVLRVR